MIRCVSNNVDNGLFRNSVNPRQIVFTNIVVIFSNSCPVHISVNTSGRYLCLKVESVKPSERSIIKIRKSSE